MNYGLIHDITEEQIHNYETDGAVCIRGQFDQEWIDRMSVAGIKHIDNPSGRRGIVDNEGDPGRLITGTHMSRFNNDFMEFAVRSPAAQIAAKLMGLNEVRFFYDQLFIKDPGTLAPTAWHNDLSFWPFDGNHVASVWIACTPVTLETSGVIYVAGSHKWGKIYKPPETKYTTIADNSGLAQATPINNSKFEEAELCPMFHKEFNNPEYRFLSWDMEAGDAIVHHPLAVHGSGKNSSNSLQRVALSLRYFGGDATWRGPRTRFCVPGTEDDSIFERGKMPINDKIFPVVWQKN